MHLKSSRSGNPKWKTKREGKSSVLELIMALCTRIKSSCSFVKSMALGNTLRYQEYLNKMEELKGLTEHLEK